MLNSNISNWEINYHYKKNHLISYISVGTTHGSPLYYDTHVPLVFLGKSIKSKQITDTVYTVDITPTLLNLIGINDLENFDGKDLTLEKE